jgi:hypothetical protein
MRACWRGMWTGFLAREKAMSETGRYLVSYDVSGARNGQRVQRRVRRHATMLLESLYHFRGDAAAFDRLVQELRARAGRSAPDVAGWRLRERVSMRCWGTALSPEGILDFRLPPGVNASATTAP